ncbi:MAG: substrate-binding domain-containing protein [Granulosicoccus sp.]
MPLNRTSPYRHRNAALSLGNIGIVTSSFASAYYSVLVDAASNYLLCRHFNVLVQSNSQSQRNKLEACAALESSDCHGLIIHADTLEEEELIQLMQKHPNVVLVNHCISAFPERCVDVDNIRGGEMAARYLVSQGHHRIAMVTGKLQYFEAKDRSLGFKRELKALGSELHVEIQGDFLEESGKFAMDRIHSEYPTVTAVFFHNDEMALGALNACKRIGLRVPEDISILGFDGIPMCEYVTPKLTTIQQPLRKLGEHAAKVVCDLLLESPADMRTIGTTFQPVLTERESVAPPAGHNVAPIALTQREVECLTWTARGKTSWEISVILGFSESTATFHLRNAGVKLKASNRANAVAKAMHLGLINFTQD